MTRCKRTKQIHFYIFFFHPLVFIPFYLLLYFANNTFHFWQHIIYCLRFFYYVSVIFLPTDKCSNFVPKTFGVTSRSQRFCCVIILYSFPFANCTVLNMWFVRLYYKTVKRNKLYYNKCLKTLWFSLLQNTLKNPI